MTAAPVPRTRLTQPAAPAMLAAAIVLVALNLRAPITSVPPLLVTIATELHLSGAAAGLLTALPVLCMGIFAPVAHAVAHATGREAAIGWALATLTLGTVVRLGSANPVLLYLGAFLAGVGIAIIGTLLPGVVKEHFTHRSGLVTGLYMAGMMVSASVASQATVPLARALGSWERALGVWAVLGVAALAVWLPVTAHARRQADAEPNGTRPRLPWRSRTAWLLALYLVCNSWEFYTQVTWIPATYELAGRSASGAATLLTTFTVTQAVSGVLGPVLADRMHDLRVLLLPAVLLGGLGTAAIALVPNLAPALWMVVLGTGLGAGFAVGLVLLVLYAADPSASARLTAMAFLISYSAASAGPVVFGWMHDLTADMRVPWLLLVGVAVLQLAVVGRLCPRRARVG